MSKQKTRKATWLLTVASAYSVLPGCSDDSSSGKPDANMASYDAGGTVSPPAVSDAAVTQDSGHEAGASDEQDAGAELDFPTLIGVILFPPGNGDLPELDAGAIDTSPDASVEDADAESEVIVGLVALPPDTSAGDQASTIARLERPPQGTS